MQLLLKRRFRRTGWLAAVAATVVFAPHLRAAQESNRFPEGAEILTRGPVHEAFAEPIMFDPDAGVLIPKTPPEPIEELPPDQRPDGANVDWIPGYWAWDDERNDFIWISGVWRALPPGREWVPGYWGRNAGGYRWTSGYWADAQADETEYLPEPPESVENGPNIAAPSADDIWSPGAWIWTERRYAWRPGYWVTARQNWDWIPAHYVWAPRGYIFVDDYWDYSIGRRGVLYAPVYFGSSDHTRRGFSYSPVTVISLSVFSDHLFVRPQWNHYYFGDYYAPSYRDAGFVASFFLRIGGRGYDPISVHERWRHRAEPDWDQRQRATFERRRDDEDARPRRTLAAQLAFNNSDSRRSDRTLTLAGSVENILRGDAGEPRIRRVDASERNQVLQRGREVQRFRSERQRTELETPERTSTQSDAVRVRANRSPVTVRQSAKVEKDDLPPERPERPKADPIVERRPRGTQRPPAEKP